ncbi:MAG: DUF2292 domain-containing protein [Schwartzia sp.]|nr:DUF2292 domain-containing protein [Schwartzia sp. (in: firmicutes)]
MEKKHSLKPGEIPGGAMAFIARGLSEIGSGRIVLTAQDSRLVQVEREERIGGEALFAANGKPGAAGEGSLPEKIRQSFRDLPYGQVIITLKDGAVRQVERLTRSRFTGLDGEGI